MLPRVMVDGRIAAEPELKFGQTGTAVCRLRMVASDRRRREDGEWEDSDTLWLDVTCFGALAEHVVESVQKGDLVLAHGKLRTEEWADRETGQKRSKISLIADAVAASLQFRVLPHAGATHAQRAPNPVQQAYGAGDPGAVRAPYVPQQDDPPF